MSADVGSPKITHHNLFLDEVRNVLVVRQYESGETTASARQHLAEWLGSNHSGYPTSQVVHETIFKGSNTIIDSSTGLALRDVTRVYDISRAGRHHLPSCKVAECSGFSDARAAESDGGSRSERCNAGEEARWYELPADSKVGGHTRTHGPLYDLMTKVERFARNKASSRGTDQDPIENTIQHNLIMIRPDLQTQDEEVLYYPKTILKRYHLPTCVDSLCPGSSDLTNARSKGIEGTSRCRPDLNYPFDHGIDTPTNINGRREDDEAYEKSCFSQLVDDLGGMVVKDEEGEMVIPEYPVLAGSRPRSRLIQLDNHALSFGQRMEETEYSIPTSQDEAPQRYLAHFEDEHTPSSPEALRSARREVCPEHESPTRWEYRNVYPKPQARAVLRSVPKSRIRTPTAGSGSDEDDLFSISPFQSGRANVQITDEDFSYVRIGDIHDTPTRKYNAGMPESKIRRSGESLKSTSSDSTIRATGSTSTTIAKGQQTQATPDTYYSPSMEFTFADPPKKDRRLRRIHNLI